MSEYSECSEEYKRESQMAALLEANKTLKSALVTAAQTAEAALGRLILAEAVAVEADKYSDVTGNCAPLGKALRAWRAGRPS